MSGSTETRGERGARGDRVALVEHLDHLDHLDRLERVEPGDPDDRVSRARRLAGAVPDPEIPVVSLAELGILRDVEEIDGKVVVTLTPTYTGCPATQVIAGDVRDALAAEGIDADVRLTLSPPWTTDWISESGRRKLRAFGIAPPGCAAPAAMTVAVVRVLDRARALGHGGLLGGGGGLGGGAGPGAAEALGAGEDVHETIACPRCGSEDVEPLSQYGSTPCKALYRCRACREPFDYFKPY